MSFLFRFLSRCLRLLVWVFGLLVMLCIILLSIAAYGIPGEWLQETFDRAIPKDVGKLKIEHLSYRPTRGLIVSNLVFYDAEGAVHEVHPRLSFSELQCKFSIFSFKPLTERVHTIVIDDLYVKQLQAGYVITERPNFDGIRLPILKNTVVTLNRANILDIEGNYARGLLNMTSRRIEMTDIFVGIHRPNDTVENAHGSVVVDFDTKVANVNLTCLLHPHRLNGIWRAIDIPIVEEYTNYFKLNAPAFGSGEIVVGLDKFDDNFDFKATLSTTHGGRYRNTSFDSASCKLHSSGVLKCRTVFSEIKAWRKNAPNPQLPAASGSLSFDCGTNRFEFQASSNALSPKECLDVTELPFEEVFSILTLNAPPEFNIEGSIPFLTHPTPDQVFLNGTLALPKGGSIGNFVFDALDEASVGMTNATLSINHAKVKLPTEDGSLKGSISFKLPKDLSYTDVHAAFHATNAVLADLAAPFEATEIPDAKLTGFADLYFPTDDRFKTDLHGDFDLSATGELITHSFLFKGLLKLFADYIPGMSSLTDSSDATFKGTVDHGIVSIPDFSLTGNLLSIEGPITYDLPNDTLFGRLSAGNFKQGSIIGTLTRWATLRVNNYVWQIRVSGSMSDPQWHIETFVKKLWDKTLGTEEKAPTASPATTKPTTNAK